MKHIAVVLLMAAAMVLAGCSTDSSSENPVTAPSPLGGATFETGIAYHYIGYSHEGRVVVQGTLSLSVSPAGRVAGRWMLRGADPTIIGPQVGTGALTGQLVNGILSINLNPENTGDNVLLNGTLGRAELSGRWQWVGSGVVFNAGTFHAVRRPVAAEEAAR